MNINRITNRRALILAAEAGALNARAATPEEDARVEELIRQAEAVIEQRPVACPLLDQMLEGEHPSDQMTPADLFPRIDFDCFANEPSTSETPGTFGNGMTGDEICARTLSRYRDSIRGLTFEEAMHLLAHLVAWMNEHHRNTGIGDTEPEYAIADAVSQYIFPEFDFKGIGRFELGKYLKREPQTI